MQENANENAAGVSWICKRSDPRKIALLDCCIYLFNYLFIGIIYTGRSNSTKTGLNGDLCTKEFT